MASHSQCSAGNDQFLETLLSAEKSLTEDMEVTPQNLDTQKRRFEITQLTKRKKATEKAKVLSSPLQKSQPQQDLCPSSSSYFRLQSRRLHKPPISPHSSKRRKPQNPKSPIPKSIEVESTAKPNWLELPIEVTANILRKLDCVEILKNARNVCPMWWNICKDPLMWRTIDMSRCNEYCNPYYDPYYGFYGEYALHFHDVDLSCGHVEDIRIWRLCTDKLLNYIADRASHLRCIKLFHCKLIFDKGLSEAAKKLPLLEELDMSLCRIPSIDTLEVLGRSCPLLRSLRLQSYYRPLGLQSNYYVWGDDPAFDIAKTMPALCRLQICDYPITNVGLLAILDGCPLLEYLKLLGCPYIDFNEDESLWKRCVGQIKDVYYH